MVIPAGKVYGKDGNFLWDLKKELDYTRKNLWVKVRSQIGGKAIF